MSDGRGSAMNLRTHAGAASIRDRLPGFSIWLALVASTASAQVYLQNLPIHQQEPFHDPVAKLIAAKPKLERRAGPLGYLPALLDALHIDSDTQALVFSKTSFQSQKISPRNPRAIYFNDEVAVGYVPGGEVMELASLDPKQGIVFYTLDTASGEIRHREECLHCHQGPATMGVPGIFIGSVFPNSNGAPSRRAAIITDHRTPFADRWGGWFVDVKAGEQLGRANRVAADPAEPESMDMRLAKSFDASAYLSTKSDIVALMTFEHQTQAVNLLTRLKWESSPEQRETDLRATADYLMFRNEAPLSEPIEGVSGFAPRFARSGPLREFDLKTRLFQSRVSYMIYSPAFAALPAEIRVRLCGMLPVCP